MENTNNQSNEINHRLKVMGISLVIGVAVVAALSFILSSPDSRAGAFLLDRHTDGFVYPFTIQNVMWIMFFIGCGELWVRFSQSNVELAEIERHYLPEDESSMLRAEDLGAVYAKVKPEDGGQGLFLQRIIKRVILQFQASRSVDQSNSLFNSSLELFQHELELKYNMLRYLVWLIPTLGFIGTVVGIAFALDYAASVENPQDPTLLAEISGRLGVAFYTTLLALIQSAFLMFALHIAQGREEMSLNQSGQYCLDNLINRLYEK
jgi:biopolymer transport protein ExbB/TolQ